LDEAMTNERIKEIEDLRSKFRNFSGWTIEYDTTAEYKSQSCICVEQKRATIYEGEPCCGEDYLLHEMLHIAFLASQGREAEEIFVQDLCSILTKAREENAELRRERDEWKATAGHEADGLESWKKVAEKVGTELADARGRLEGVEDLVNDNFDETSGIYEDFMQAIKKVGGG
jgi:hypothetical protein